MHALRTYYARRATHDARGFTMVELLVALAILVIALTIIFGAFTTTVSAWQKGGDMLENLRHGDFVMEQLVSALRSAAFFKTAPDKYGFRLENNSGEYDEDMLSWVTSGTAFLPPDSPYANGLHRLVVTVEDDDDGERAFAIRAFPHLAEIEDDELDPWFVSSEVKGINCRTYNIEDESWEDRWEDTNAIPSLLEITLYMDPIEEYGDPLTLVRLVEIPVAALVTQAVSFTQGEAPEGSGTSEGEQAITQ